MTTRRLIVAAVFTSLSLAAFVSAQPGSQPGDQPGNQPASQPGGQPGNAQPAQSGAPGAPERGRPARAAAQPESLGRLMNSMGRGLRTLKRQIGNPEAREENLQLLVEMQRAAVLSKGQKPGHIPQQLSEQDRKAYLDDFRLQNIDLVTLLLRAERSLVTGDVDDAAKALAEVESLRDSAHAKFAPGEDEQPAFPAFTAPPPPARNGGPLTPPPAPK